MTQADAASEAGAAAKNGAQNDAKNDAKSDAKTGRRLAETLRKYLAAPPPGAFRAGAPEAAALASPEGLAQVRAELRALKQERRALRRLENLILTALGVEAQPDPQAAACDDEEE